MMIDGGRNGSAAWRRAFRELEGAGTRQAARSLGRANGEVVHSRPTRFEWICSRPVTKRVHEGSADLTAEQNAPDYIWNPSPSRGRPMIKWMTRTGLHTNRKNESDRTKRQPPVEVAVPQNWSSGALIAQPQFVDPLFALPTRRQNGRSQAHSARAAVA
jgi:hypothetical protein